MKRDTADTPNRPIQLRLQTTSKLLVKAVALMLFGWGFWFWSVPALAALIWAAHREWRQVAVVEIPEATASPANETMSPGSRPRTIENPSSPGR